MHDARRHLQRLAGEADAGERLQRLRARRGPRRRNRSAPRPRAASPRCRAQSISRERDPRLRLAASSDSSIIVRLPSLHGLRGNAPTRPSSSSGRNAGTVPSRDRTSQAMMSGMFDRAIRWISSFSRSFRLFSRASSSWSIADRLRQARDLLVEPAMLGLEQFEAWRADRRRSSPSKSSAATASPELKPVSTARAAKPAERCKWPETNRANS